MSSGSLAGCDFGHQFLCRLADIPEGGKGFWFGADTERLLPARALRGQPSPAG